MFLFACCLSAVLFWKCGVRLSQTRRFVRALEQSPRVWPVSELPPAAVILSLRGDDPFLRECLENLSRLDYPDFHVRIVIDSPNDPAARVVAQFLDETRPSNFQVDPLTDRRPHCSLKVSSLIQALQSLDERYEFVAIVDADALVHPAWLRDMIGPFVDPLVGATTGVRWYLPASRDLASVARRQWNIGAVVQMFAFGIPWGGSLAMRRSFLRDAGQLERWSNTLCEDTPLAETLAEHGQRLQLVPRAVLVNRESITLPALRRFINRQLLFTRLYHPRWRRVFASGVLGFAGLLAGIATTATAAMTAALPALVAGAATLVFAWAYLVQIKWASRAVRRLMRDEHGIELPRSSLGVVAVLAAFVSVPLHFVGVLSALRAHVVSWRGIRYVREDRRRYRIDAYVPYQSTASADATHSL